MDPKFISFFLLSVKFLSDLLLLSCPIHSTFHIFDPYFAENEVDQAIFNGLGQPVLTFALLFPNPSWSSTGPLTSAPSADIVTSHKPAMTSQWNQDASPECAQPTSAWSFRHLPHCSMTTSVLPLCCELPEDRHHISSLL